MANMAVHWTDVEFQGRTVEEVDVLVACLKEGLRILIEGFGVYMDELGISEREIKEANALIGSM